MNIEHFIASDKPGKNHNNSYNHTDIGKKRIQQTNANVHNNEKSNY